MASNYPPPPNPEQSHYNPIYSTETDGGAEQLLDPAVQDQQLYNQLSQQSSYPKLEGEQQLDPDTSQQIEQRIEQLQHQQPLAPHGQPQDPQDHEFAPLPQQQENEQESGETASKVNRLRKACDSCSIRKVKCDESGPPCRACSALEIPCTFERPSRRRGPPNRHAEAIKRRRLDSPTAAVSPVPSSPTHAAQALAALSSHTAAQPHLSAESICPIETIDLLINDYFTYIYPTSPFPHEPSFREAWRRREDYNNRPFLALLASMIAALVASFPRQARLQLSTQRKDRMFPNHLPLVEKAQKVCVAARGTGFQESKNLSVHDAATSYLLGLTCSYTYKWQEMRMYFGECLTIIRALGLDKPREHTYTPLGLLPFLLGSHGPDYQGSEDEMLDNITLEMGKRIFWTMFVTTRTLAQFGTNFAELAIAPENPSHVYPPLPSEVDDFYIFPGHLEQSPPGLVPIIAGFNANVRTFLTCATIHSFEFQWGVDVLVDWRRQQKILLKALHSYRNSNNDLPLELTPSLSSDSLINGNAPATGFQPSFGDRDPAMISAGEQPDPDERHNMQYEIQKATIYVNKLSTRTYVVEKFLDLLHTHQQNPNGQSGSHSDALALVGDRLDQALKSEASGPEDTAGIRQEMAREREAITKDLVGILSGIDKINTGPAAYSFTNKVRTIARKMLSAPKDRKGVVAKTAEPSIASLLDVLARLEHTTTPPSHNNDAAVQALEDEEDGRLWTELRMRQMELLEQGSLMGLA